MVTTKDWPSHIVPTAAVQDTAKIVGRTVITPIIKGEPVVMGRLADEGSGTGIAALIPDGYRAYTIQTSRIASNVAGFVMPGHRVDVLLTLRGGRDDETGGGSSTTLLQAVDILAVNGLLQPPTENHVDPKQMDSVTLLVTPDQAGLLDLGQNIGKLTLSLRNLDDIAESKTMPATVNLLRYTQREPMLAEVSRALGGQGGDDTLVDRITNAIARRDGTADASTDQPRIETMRPPVPEVVPTPSSDQTDSVLSNESAQPLPEIEAIQTFRGRHSGRVLIRSEL